MSSITLQIEMWTLDRIRPYENNPRVNEGAVDAVAASIREFGFAQPIVVDTDSVIIVGHTRLKAAQKLGLEGVTTWLRLGKSRVGADQREPPLSTLSTREIVMNHKHIFAIAIVTLVTLVGCEEPAVRVRSLPVPAAEQPSSNLPAALHQRNWTGSLGQGSCVHASLVNHLRWLNEFELGERWRTTYSDGEWDSRLRDRLDAAGIDYSYTIKADPRFLDWASNTRRGAILWWKPSHCCTFVGWVIRIVEQDDQ